MLNDYYKGVGDFDFVSEEFVKQNRELVDSIYLWSDKYHSITTAAVNEMITTHFLDSKICKIYKAMNVKEISIKAGIARRRMERLADVPYITPPWAKPGVIYRGVRTTQDKFDEVIRLGHMQNPARLRSYTTSIEQASLFSNRGVGDLKILYQVDSGARGMYIGNFSYYQHEQEVISRGIYNITGVEENKHGFDYIIHLAGGE